MELFIFKMHFWGLLEPFPGEKVHDFPIGNQFSPIFYPIFPVFSSISGTSARKSEGKSGVWGKIRSGNQNLSPQMEKCEDLEKFPKNRDPAPECPKKNEQEFRG